MGPTNYEAGPGHKSWDFMKQVKEGVLQAEGWVCPWQQQEPRGLG